MGNSNFIFCRIGCSIGKVCNWGSSFYDIQVCVSDVRWGSCLSWIACARSEC